MANRFSLPAALIIARLEWRQLGRSLAGFLAATVLLGASLVAVHHGRTVVDRQRMAIAESPALQAEQHQAILAAQPQDANGGDQLYYLFFHTVHEPSEWAAVSLGQRDLHPYNLKIRLLALHGQLYDVELGNPLLAAFGSFDLAFILVFVMPLFVIALTHNLWSLEREQGTWPLAISQPIAPSLILGLKLAVRLVTIVGPLATVLAASVWWLQLSVDRRLVTVAVLCLLYVVAWAGAAVLVGALRRSSDFNLAVLLAIWIVGCVLGPALVNAMAAVRYPSTEGLELTVRARQGYHEAWDAPLQETMARFYERYPEWRDVPIPTGTYSNGWYFAMQQRGDDEAAPAVDAYRLSLAQRQAWVGSALALFPPALFQSALNGIARTDLDSHLAYVASVASYHEELKRYFFPVAFHDTPVHAVSWNSAPRHRFTDDRAIPPLGGPHGVALGAWAAAVVLVASVSLSRVRR
jgi:ABC-2 type transport system permease protein